MKTILIIAGVALLVYVSYRTYRIATQEKGLDKLMANRAIILDVRTETEFKTGHINGSMNMPLGKMRERYRELDTGSIYITCCSHGLRSVKAVAILKERGFRKVYNGGAWPDLAKIVNKQKSKRD